ncbi:acetyl-CoA C-acetyltransferase [Nevskia sp.]|uniref:acetyl-CoA C-acetyltransferase n=1 Tax=Nevskia sp. TaxID=1929292 RepID=UPI003F70A42F
MQDVVIIDAARTAIGRFGGSLAGVPATELGARLIAALVARAQLPAEQVDLVLMGQVLSAGAGQNPARQAAIKAGLAQSTPALTVSHVCGSGLSAVIMAMQAIRAGDAELVVAGGMENMSAAPHALPNSRDGQKMGPWSLVDTMIVDGLWDAFNGYHMGQTAENLAVKYGISREAQDAFAARSQNRAEAAIDAGRFASQIVPLTLPAKKGATVEFAVDEFVRRGVSAESLAGLKPAFSKSGTVTAANASGLNDGAAAVIVASAAKAKALGLPVLATIRGGGWSGVDPAIMGIGPVTATRRALGRAGWTLADLDLIEANEAFAAQALAVGQELGWDDTKVNVNGGAIALGHPIGASGARVLVTLLHELKARGAARGLATLCIGGGQGVALAVERA